MEKIRKILSNKDQGVKWLYENYGRKLLGYSNNVYKISEDAGWDMVYKTIYKVQEVHDQYTFESQEKFASFIFRIFINYLKNHIRDENTKTQGAVFIPLDETRKNFVATSGSVASTNPQMAMLREELEKLEDWQRILLLMRSQEVPYSEIAKYVNKPEEQLKVYYSRLKNALTEKMVARENQKKTASLTLTEDENKKEEENKKKEAVIINIRHAS
ncbi:MAG: sigma-70 family RNA polymerase sigma factor [Bacteroidia bacterium]|nr:sigma-70 family RNA polymerase sigma factor [Bacteroidia bacterium]